MKGNFHARCEPGENGENCKTSSDCYLSVFRITTDGRKIGLDQRLINPLLPDFEGSKVNVCAENIYRIWRDTSGDRLTQLAVTWIKPLKVRGGRSVHSTISDIIDYTENPLKTDRYRLVTSYACDYHTADTEFLLAKQEYEHITGRNNGKNNVLAYHIRQAFKPGEVSPEEANEIGQRLAASFTKNKHAFIVCTHIDREHVHNHIIFNSTTLNCERKFDNFYRTDKVIRRISDLLCVEHGLSIIENPKPSKGNNYGEWLGDDRPPTHRDVLRQKIDEIVPSCATFEDFIARLRTDGYTVNDRRKHITVKAPDWSRPARLDTLKGDYTEDAIRARIGPEKVLATGGDGGTNLHAPTMQDESKTEPTHISLLIDIQSKIQEGKGGGYRQWATLENLRRAAKTLLFLQENGVDSYEELVKKSSSSSDDFSALMTRIKDTEARMKSIAELQKQIGTYGKTREVYAQYRASNWSRKFYNEHTADIILHRAAKKYFDEQGFKGKLPSMKALKQEYAALSDEKKKLYVDYHAQKDKSREWAIARDNAEMLLGLKESNEKAPHIPQRETPRHTPDL